MPAKQTKESMEAELGLPRFYRSKPIVERMAALGYDQAAIDHVKTWLDVLTKIVSGRHDELPDHVRNELAADADAELSGPELLVDSRASQPNPHRRASLDPAKAYRQISRQPASRRRVRPE